MLASLCHECLHFSRQKPLIFFLGIYIILLKTELFKTWKIKKFVHKQTEKTPVNVDLIEDKCV